MRFLDKMTILFIWITWLSCDQKKIQCNTNFPSMEDYGIDPNEYCYNCDSLIQEKGKIETKFVSFKFKVDKLKDDSARVYIPFEFSNHLRVDYAGNLDDLMHYITTISCNTQDEKIRLSYHISEYDNEPYFPNTGLHGLDITKNVFSIEPNKIYISKNISDGCTFYKYKVIQYTESGYFRLTLINVEKKRIIEVILQDNLKRMKMDHILATMLYSIKDISGYTNF